MWITLEYNTHWWVHSTVQYICSIYNEGHQSIPSVVGIFYCCHKSYPSVLYHMLQLNWSIRSVQFSSSLLFRNSKFKVFRSTRDLVVKHVALIFGRINSMWLFQVQGYYFKDVGASLFLLLIYILISVAYLFVSYSFVIGNIFHEAFCYEPFVCDC
jgi:hypothetical protein